MKKFAEYLILALKGVGMGAANVIPGVSGGTIAFITGIYERLIACINNIDATAMRLLFSGKLKELWKYIDGAFLLSLFAGVAVATFSLAKLMLILLGAWPIQTWAFFFGLIIASSVIMLGGIKAWHGTDVIWLVAGVALGAVVCSMGDMSSSPEGLWFYFICGAVSICAMILPGLSGSYILMMMGKYEEVMQSIVGVLRLDGYSIIILAVFALGCVAGLLAFAKLLHFLLERFNRQTLLSLCGFVLGSLVGVWPWSHEDAIVRAGYSPDGYPELIPAIICCIVGAALVFALEKIGSRTRK